MLKIKQTVIVEGKYDKIRLENIIDAQIITTGGFDIYNDREKRKLLIKLADKNGIIVLTDSDRAGFKIRSHLSGILPAKNVVNLFIPQKEGKESRKEAPSKDGFLGVEGTDNEVLYRLFLPYASDTGRHSAEITKAMMYEWGLCGRDNSKELRKMLCKKLDLPETLSPNSLTDALNMMFEKSEIENAIEELLHK